MRILFLSHYFPPEVNAPATRTYEHCKEWVKQGHQVTVISCVPHHPMGKVYPGYKNRLFFREEKDGIQTIKILTYVTANEGFVKRTFNYVFFMVMAVLVAPFVGKADVVLSTSPQFFNGLAGYFVSRMKRAGWVLEIRDLWPESILAVGAIKNKHVIRLLESIERFVYRKADYIVPVTKAFKKHIIANGGNEARTSVIRNGVDLTLFNPMPRDETYAEQIGVGGKFVASYVGTHGMAHGLDVVIEAAEKLKNNTNVVFLLVGEGAEKTRLKEVVESRNLSNVIMLDQQSKDQMPLIWLVSDVSLVLLRKLDLFLTVIPSKIFESMAMGKPIVMGVMGEAQELIEKGNAGLCIEPENADQLVEALNSLQSNKGQYEDIAESAKNYVAENFNRRDLARRYEQILVQTQNNYKAWRKSPLTLSANQSIEELDE